MSEAAALGEQQTQKFTSGLICFCYAEGDNVLFGSQCLCLSALVNNVQDLRVSTWDKCLQRLVFSDKHLKY